MFAYLVNLGYLPTYPPTNVFILPTYLRAYVSIYFYYLHNLPTYLNM